MIDVSQVLEFPSPKFYLLRQLSINKINNISADELNKDPQKVSECFYRWRMSVNP